MVVAWIMLVPRLATGASLESSLSLEAGVGSTTATGANDSLSDDAKLTTKEATLCYDFVPARFGSLGLLAGFGAGYLDQKYLHDPFAVEFRHVLLGAEAGLNFSFGSKFRLHLVAGYDTAVHSKAIGTHVYPDPVVAAYSRFSYGTRLLFGDGRIRFGFAVVRRQASLKLQHAGSAVRLSGNGYGAVLALAL